MIFWILGGVIVATVFFLIWISNKKCEGHDRSCPACHRNVRLFHVGTSEMLVGHEPPECLWFTQKMEKVAGDAVGRRQA